MPEKITKRAVDALKAKAKADGKNCCLFDSELRGFAALATKTGNVSYIVEYRMPGQAARSPRRFTLGRHGELTPDEARRRAQVELGKVRDGKDIAEQRKEAREKLAGLTFAEGVEKFLGIHAESTRYWKEKRARLFSDDVKALASKPLATISRKHVADAIDSAMARSEAAARLLFADLRPFFKWAHERELMDANPMAGLALQRLPAPVTAF